MKTNILELDNIEALAFFLENESYFSLEMPDYFDFSKLLQRVHKKIAGKDIETFFHIPPKTLEKVNYHLLNNKDGQYWRRLFQLIHPVLYVALVDIITSPDNRQEIVTKFHQYKENNLVECFSYPKLSHTKKTNKSEQILKWRNDIEQQSIKLSLEYDYVFHTDITDCYSSIYTHAIPWALHTKPISKANETDSLLWNRIDKLFRYMQFWQTNWIPQWSFLMDFIAELVLAYIDNCLTSKIAQIKQFENFKIIRYRDDYKIFVNSPNIGKEIIKELTTILSDVGMKLNTNKTTHSDNIITSSIKADKLAWIRQFYWTRNNVQMKQAWKEVSFQKTDNIYEEFLLIREFSEQCPNSWALAKELSILHKKVENTKIDKQQIDVMVAIIVDIGLKSPRVYNSISWILTYLIDGLNNEEKIWVIKKVKNKFNRTPNTEYLNIRLQRITYHIEKDFIYWEGLCEKVNNSNALLRDSTRLKWELQSIVGETDIINRKYLQDMNPKLSSSEISIFEY